MPLYEYHCTNCNNNTELLQKMSDEPAKTCPHCHKDNLIKQISAAGFQLMVSGWYVTDVKNQSKNTTASEPKKTESKTDTSSENK